MEYWRLSDKSFEARTSLLGLENMRVIRDFRKSGKRHIVINRGETILYVTESPGEAGRSIIRFKDAVTEIILLQITYNSNYSDYWDGLAEIILRAATYFYPISTIGREQMIDMGLEFVKNTIVDMAED